MADNRPKKSRKRHHDCPDFPAKRHLIESPQSSQGSLMPSTLPSELLRCLGLFLQQRCSKINFNSARPINRLRNIDTYLLTTGYQRASFLSTGSIVFLYMLCRDLISPEIDSMEQLQAKLLTCYYISHCYIGHGLGYPVKPFLVGSSKTSFWERCLSYIKIMSFQMMKINNNHQFYGGVLAELQAIGR